MSVPPILEHLYLFCFDLLVRLRELCLCSCGFNRQRYRQLSYLKLNSVSILHRPDDEEYDPTEDEGGGNDDRNWAIGSFKFHDAAIEV
jgi:hypothetical protein